MPCCGHETHGSICINQQNSSARTFLAYLFAVCGNNVLSLHPRYKCKMDITFEKDYLRELFYDGVASDKQHRYQPDVVRRYVRVVNILDSVDKPADLFRYRSLHYEKLVGDKAGLESVRVNDKYRIEFRTSSNGTITICNIIELSNHYK